MLLSFTKIAKGARLIIPIELSRIWFLIAAFMIFDYIGPEFTWYRGFCSVRLDRCLGNSLWFEAFPSSTLHHLLRMKSDHRLLLLSSSGFTPSSRLPMFKYFAGWSKHQDFKRLVTANWDSSQPLSDMIKSFTATAISWNKEVFGSIGKNKRILMARLRGVQRCLDQKRTKGLLKLEQKLLAELEILLDHEEQLWK
ncbi:hypothetical protein V6N13_052964 [Hibiscus sabdariffa]